MIVNVEVHESAVVWATPFSSDQLLVIEPGVVVLLVLFPITIVENVEPGLGTNPVLIEKVCKPQSIGTALITKRDSIASISAEQTPSVANRFRREAFGFSPNCRRTPTSQSENAMVMLSDFWKSGFKTSFHHSGITIERARSTKSPLKAVKLEAVPGKRRNRATTSLRRAASLAQLIGCSQSKTVRSVELTKRTDLFRARFGTSSSENFKRETV